MNDIQKSILTRSIKIRLDRGEDVTEIFSNYKNLTDGEKNELLGAFNLSLAPATLDEAKKKKIAELSSICQKRIEDGVTISIDGVDESFTYGIDNGDQGNIDDIFNLCVSTKLPQPYHCTNGNCKLYTPEQIAALYVAVKMNKAEQTTYFNQLKQMIEETYTEDGDIATVNAIEYGVELTGKYLENYNAMMQQSQLINQSLVSVLSQNENMESDNTGSDA